MGENSGRTVSQQKRSLSQQFPSTDSRYASVLATLCTSMTSLNLADPPSGFILQNDFAVCVHCNGSDSTEAGCRQELRALCSFAQSALFRAFWHL